MTMPVGNQGLPTAPAAAPDPIRVAVMGSSSSERRSLAALFGAQSGIRAQVAAGPEEWDALRHDFDPRVLVFCLQEASPERGRFVENLLRDEGLPVVLCGGEKEEEMAFRLLERGATATLPAPDTGSGDQLSDAMTLLIGQVQRSARGPLSFDALRRRVVSEAIPRDQWRRGRRPGDGPVVAVAAGEGGTMAVADLLRAMPEDAPGIVISTRLPQEHTAAFVRRLAAVCRMDVKAAEPNDPIRAGQVLVAPGNLHVLVNKDTHGPFVEVVNGPLVWGHRPNFDVLFRSVAHSVGAKSLGVMLTGLGEDGPTGLAVLGAAGGHTAAQEASTCFAPGVAKAAVDSGAAREAVPLTGLPQWILEKAAGCLEPMGPL